MKAERFITNALLSEIRRNADWRLLFAELGIEKDETKSRPNDWWGKSPFNPAERHSSFHMNDRGFYCFSSGENGGTVELVQRVFASRGEVLNCYDAGRWMVEHGISHCPEIGVGVRADHSAHSDDGKTDGGHETASGEKEKRPNEPIRQNLVPLLTQVGTHPEFTRRGISRETCEYLGCGVLESGKSPLAGRVVFQIRGLRYDDEKNIKPVILSHMGRALTAEQEDSHGKWLMYSGFTKTLELYNIDKILTDQEARKQLDDTGHVILVEGAFDVAKLVEAGIRNVVASFGAHLAEEQLDVFEFLAAETGIRRVLIWYDRGSADPAGARGTASAIDLLNIEDFIPVPFDWEMEIPSPQRGKVRIPATITDPGGFSTDQLYWLRSKKMI